MFLRCFPLQLSGRGLDYVLPSLSVLRWCVAASAPGVTLVAAHDLTLAEAGPATDSAYWVQLILALTALLAATALGWSLLSRRRAKARAVQLESQVRLHEGRESELWAKQGMLTHAQRLARMGCWERDLQTNCMTWSAESADVLGLEARALPAAYDAFVDCVHPEDRAKRDAAFARALSGDGLTSVEYRLRTKEGAERVIRERGEIIRDASGTARREFGVVMDVTDQRASELAAKKSESLLRMAGRLGRMGGWTVELPDLRVIWSEEVCGIHGMPSGYAPTAEQAIASYAPEWREPARRAMEACITEGTPFDFEAQILLAAGGRGWVRTIGEADRDGEGVVKRIKGAQQDITERKALEQQFLRAQRQESIGTLAGGIAHDLNNVLTPILMSIDLLRLRAREPEDLRVLDTINVSAKRGAEMVRQVLSFARGTPGSRVSTPARHLLREIEHIIQDTFPKAIVCEVRVADDLWPVLCDPTQVHQVLLNLCVNARDAMPKGGLLTLSAANLTLGDHDLRASLAGRAGRYVRFEVADTGAGIPADLREKIFDPFFTTKEVGRGTGLGLSTASNIVRAHGGLLQVASEVGRGSTFRVFLPAADTVAVSGSTAPGFVLPRGRGETVLVVDDEEAVRVIMRQALEGFGYQVMEAENGADAVALYVQRRTEIDLVLTDIMMPIMDGLTTIRTLLNLDPGLPIIGSSGLNAGVNRSEALDAGAKEFLAKPFTAETLLMTVRTVLASRPPSQG